MAMITKKENSPSFLSQNKYRQKQQATSTTRNEKAHKNTAKLERKPLDMIIKHGKVCPQNPISLNSPTKQAKFPVPKF